MAYEVKRRNQFNADVFRGARLPSLPTNERRAPLKTPVWEARSAFALWRELVSVNAAKSLMRSQPTKQKDLAVDVLCKS